MAYGAVKHSRRKIAHLRGGYYGSRRLTIQVQVGRALSAILVNGKRKLVGKAAFDAMACLGRKPSGFGPSKRKGGARCAHAYGKSPTSATKRAVNALLRKVR